MAPTGAALEAITAIGDPMPVEASAAVDPVAEERSLRNALATSGDPALPALDLAGLLCTQERHAEALAVVQAAQQRSVDPRLRLARAGLLRDLGRRRDAARELRSLVQERGAVELHPKLLLEWVELEWIEGETTAAQGALDVVLDAHASHPWCVEHRAAIATLGTAIARGQRPGRVEIQDLMGDLRGAPDVAVRQRALENLLLIASSHEGDDGAANLHRQALANAIVDESPVVRARAVALASATAAETGALITGALTDEATGVRLAAARRVPEVLHEEDAAALVDRLGVEPDPTVFAQLHHGLVALLGPGPVWSTDGGDEARSRAALVDAWRQRCSR